MRINPMLPVAVAFATIAAAPLAQVLPGGTRITDVKIGAGAMAVPGALLTMHYTGWLYQDGVKAKKFDSSRDRGQPFQFVLGDGQVIAGWDEGIAGMKVGGKRSLIIPPAMGYGNNGAGDDIPPGATLIFDVELLAIAN